MTSTKCNQGKAPARAIREGLLQFDPPRLLGSRCVACGTVMFPAREFCPACDATGMPESVALSDSGILHSFTVVHQAPPGRATPYALGLVDLDDGVRVLAQVDIAPADLDLGLKLRLDLRVVGAAEDHALIGYAFVAAGGPGEGA